MKKILCIHGIGGKDATMNQWSPEWEKAITDSSGFTEQLQFHFLKIDDLFTESKARMGGIKYVQAIGKFISSWVSTTIEEKLKSRGLLDTINWYAGMPAQFATDDELRRKLQARMDTVIRTFQPDVIFTHSLGTLIAYDFIRQKSVIGTRFDFVLITSGSQIGHPALRQLFGGVILSLSVKYWINLRNENDRVFASRNINVEADNYLQVETPFESAAINHDAVKYITQSNAVAQAWPVVVAQSAARVARSFAINKLSSSSLEKQTTGRKSNRKALLIGINDYPDPQNRLEGCVNDVFRMSEVLQEFGFAPEEIRVTLNERATAKEIRSRLKWLLDDAKQGDLRFFFYSGHGAQIPTPHDDYEQDGNDECLVPYDFDWTLEHAYTDKEFLELYSHLSKEINFITVFDCCHSGGLTRASGIKSRGLNPPDDIRHREIKWDAARQMWIRRDQKLTGQKFFKNKVTDSTNYNGLNGKTNKLGRAFPLWTDVKDVEKAKKKYGATGPYMPVILEACGEGESAYEYRHGVTSYGAFTYSLSTILRQQLAKGKKVSFNELVSLTAQQLKELEYNQNPVLVGPKVRTEGKLPFALK